MAIQSERLRQRMTAAMPEERPRRTAKNATSSASILRSSPTSSGASRAIATYTAVERPTLAIHATHAKASHGPRSVVSVPSLARAV